MAWRFPRSAPGPVEPAPPPAARAPAGLAPALSHALTRIAVLATCTQAAQDAVRGAFTQITARARTVGDEAGAVRTTAEAARGQAEAQRAASAAQLEALGGQAQAAIDGLSTTLSERLGRAAQVLEVIERSGRTLETLAVNAKIQAMRAGEAGRAFSVVADAIRELATDNRGQAARIAAELDFGPFRAQFERFVAEHAGVLDTATAEIADRFESLVAQQAAIVEAASRIDAANRVIPELLGIADQALARQTLTLAPIGEAARSAADAVTPTLATLAPVLDRASARSIDALADIRARGTLRVAIEPGFWGLSFRTRPGDALTGLDAETARAFARHLGVAVEFVERPWVECPALLWTPARRGGAPADLMWSALIPADSYAGVAFSTPYLRFPFVLVRRTGDARITGLSSLAGRVLACIDDPAAFALLADLGLSWDGAERAGARIRLDNLAAYADLNAMFDALEAGRIDALAIDQPLAGWSCAGEASRWRGRLEVLPQPVTDEAFGYAVGVRADAGSAGLLAEVEAFLRRFAGDPERAALHRRFAIAEVPARG